MTDANDAIKPLHDRMPVFLFENEWDKWMAGSFDDLMAFQGRTFPDELIEMERTSELWVKRRTKEVAPPSP